MNMQQALLLCTYNREIHNVYCTTTIPRDSNTTNETPKQNHLNSTPCAVPPVPVHTKKKQPIRTACGHRRSFRTKRKTKKKE